jgi:hypothetical protein
MHSWKSRKGLAQRRVGGAGLGRARVEKGFPEGIRLAAENPTRRYLFFFAFPFLPFFAMALD